jgi:hypothetical protein
MGSFSYLSASCVGYAHQRIHSLHRLAVSYQCNVQETDGHKGHTFLAFSRGARWGRKRITLHA